MHAEEHALVPLKERAYFVTQRWLYQSYVREGMEERQVQAFI